jgi:transposase
MEAEAMAYSMDLRERVVEAAEAEPQSVVAERFGVSRPTVKEWRERAERGELEPDKPGPKGPLKFTSADDAYLRRKVEEQPGITARELLPGLSCRVDESSVCRRLRELGLSLKGRR